MTSKQGLVARILRRHGSSSRTRGKILRRLAKKLGLVYFGAVDQHRDEHQVIRGLTVSTTHRDEHYAVGSYDGYDVSLVDRFDILVHPDGTSTSHNWVIFQIDLTGTETLPHLFLRPLGHAPAAYARFFKAFSHLQPIHGLFLGGHSTEFLHRYELYGTSAHAARAEELFTPQVTQVLAARLWPHAVELFENKLYLYVTEQTVNQAGLEATLETGLWLARLLDRLEADD